MSGLLGIPAGGEGAEMPARSHSMWSEGEFGRMKSRRGGEGHTPPTPKIKNARKLASRMPAGASLSPCGDLGELSQTEAVAVFPALKRMGGHTMRAADHLPAPKGLVK